MRKIITTLILITSASMAHGWDRHAPHDDQPPHRGMPPKHHMVDHPPFMRNLDLSEEQKAKIDKILDENRPKKEQLLGHEIIFSLDPLATDYQKQIDEQAIKIAAQAKEDFLKRAKVHAQIYHTLNEEQREKIKQNTQCKFSHKKG